jgi:hypothetical protein
MNLSALKPHLKPFKTILQHAARLLPFTHQRQQHRHHDSTKQQTSMHRKM